MNNIFLAFLLTFIAGFSTTIGTFLIFFKDNREVVLKYSLSLSAGVMICVSFLDLIPESIFCLYNNDRTCTFIMCGFFVFIGVLFSFVIDKMFSKNNSSNELYKLGIFSMFAIILHNIPEGIMTFLSSVTDISLGLSITAAIALHNIPEGISISMPIFKATNSRKKAFLYTFISGMSEPFGALLAFLFLKPIINNTIMGILAGLVAGIMIYIGFLKLLPEALKYKKKMNILFCFLLGMGIIYASHILLN